MEGRKESLEDWGFANIWGCLLFSDPTSEKEMARMTQPVQNYLSPWRKVQELLWFGLVAPSDDPGLL